MLSDDQLTQLLEGTGVSLPSEPVKLPNDTPIWIGLLLIHGVLFLVFCHLMLRYSAFWPMEKKAILRLVFRLHAWLGLITGLFLLVLGLSGSALVYMDELDFWLNHDRFTLSDKGNRLPLDSLYGQITRRYPSLDGIAWLNPQTSPNEAFSFRLYLNDGKLHTYDLGMLTLNPYTGDVLREGRNDELSAGLMPWLFQFHFSFHAGMPGAALTAVFGLTMLLSILTGVLVYRKYIWKVLLFRVRIKRKNWRTLASDLHRVIGVWALLLNAIIFFTGFWMNLFAFEPAVWQTETKLAKPNQPIRQSLDSMLVRARRVMPDLEVSYVYWPTQSERKFSIRGSRPGDWGILGKSNSVAIDAQTGEVKAIQRIEDASWPEKLEAMVHPLHVGLYGGWPIKWLYIVLGLTPGLLSVTGALLWWRRNRKIQ